MRTAIFSLASCVLMALSAPAVANESPECSGLFVSTTQTDYPLQDIGIESTTRPTQGTTPVSQNMIALTCGKFTIDWWTSTGLTTEGAYGNRGGMDEHDFELTYADTVTTPIGPINLALYGAYFALDLGKGLGSSDDDFAQFYAEAAKPLPVGTWTMTPFVRYIETVGVGSVDGFTTIRSGARLDGPVTIPVFGEATFHGEAAHSHNHGNVPYKSVWRGEALLSKPISKTLTIGVGAKFTEHVGVTFIPVKFVRSF